MGALKTAKSSQKEVVDPATQVSDGCRKGTNMNPKYWYIDGVAYDFAPFVKQHPGGQYALFLGQGRECKPLIYSYHMDIAKVEKYFETYKCPDSEQLEDPENDKFFPSQKFTYEADGLYMTCKRAAAKYFKDKNISHKAGFWGIFTFAANLCLTLAMMYYMITTQSYIVAFIHGISRAIMVVQSTHGGSHFAWSFNPAVNRWVYRLGTIFIGLWNPKVWDIQHVVAHHIYTNEWPYDTDSAFPIKSIAYNQKRFAYHKFQHIYMWFVYAFTIPLVYLNSLKDTIMGNQMLFKLNYQVNGSFFEAWACSILGAIYLLLPWAFMPFTNALCIVLFSNVVSSLYFSLQFVVNHEVDTIVEDGPPPQNVDWGEFQCMGSTSFAPDSYLSTELAGGLNTQIEHHLFPGVYYGHYVDLHNIIKDICKDFGVEYNERPTLWAALVGHYKLLKNPPKSIRSKKSKKAKSL